MKTIILTSCLVLGLTMMPSVSFAGTLPPQILTCGEELVFENQANSATQVVIQVENGCSTGTCTLKARDATGNTVDFATIPASGVKAIRFTVKKAGGSVLLGCEGTGTAAYSITTTP